MTPALTLLFAVCGGAAVGNLYWIQPLLGEVAQTLRVAPASASYLVTATQLGYALGALLIVPLGDVLNRRRLIPIIMALSSAALLCSALATSFGALLAALAALGLTTVSGQLLMPMAGDLVRDDQRGRVIGTIASGMLSGILLSRTISGLVGDAFGWRTIYFAAAAVSLTLASTLGLKLPKDLPRAKISYPSLLLSIGQAVLRHRAAQVSLAVGACAFCVFTMFWTGLTFLLSSPPFSYSVSQIGLVGLVGLAGALAARRAGKLHDCGWSAQGTGVGVTLTLLSVGLAASASHSLALVLLSVLLIDIAIQMTNVLNQSRLLSIEPESRSRLNTAFIICNFAGGAVGSALSALLWQQGGWISLMTGAGFVAATGLICWAIGRRTLMAASPQRPDR